MKKILVTGNVGRDPEERHGQNNNRFVSFSLAVRTGTKQNPRTDWLDITCSDRQADFVLQYVKKGTKLLIEGTPSVNAYIDKNNQVVGTQRVYANTIEFIGSREQTDDAYSQQSAPSQQPYNDHNQVKEGFKAPSVATKSADVDIPKPVTPKAPVKKSAPEPTQASASIESTKVAPKPSPAVEEPTITSDFIPF